MEWQPIDKFADGETVLGVAGRTMRVGTLTTLPGGRGFLIGGLAEFFPTQAMPLPAPPTVQEQPMEQLRDKIIDAMISNLPPDPDGDDMRAAADAILNLPELKSALARAKEANERTEI